MDAATMDISPANRTPESPPAALPQAPPAVAPPAAVNPASVPLPATPVKAPARGRVSLTSPMTPRSAAALARARESAAKGQELMSAARDRAAEMGRHPAAVRVGSMASKQADNARSLLGRSEAVVRAEKMTGIDRLPLVLAAAAIFTALIPFNLLGLALPVAAALALAGPTYQAVQILDSGSDQDVKNTLVYFIVLGLVQTVESLMGRVLERNIRWYHAGKLVILFYLSHSKWKGAEKVHDLLFKRSTKSAVATPTKEATNDSAEGFDLAASSNGYPKL